jgi:hypothetical protein
MPSTAEPAMTSSMAGADTLNGGIDNDIVRGGRG